MTNLSLIAILFLLAFVSIDQSMVNNLALLGIGILSFFNAHKIMQTKEKINVVSDTTDAIHTLSNSAMGAQLRVNVEFARSNAVLCHRLADTTKESSDAAAAVAADLRVKEQEALLQAHLIQQAKVDATEIAKVKEKSGG